MELEGYKYTNMLTHQVFQMLSERVYFFSCLENVAELLVIILKSGTTSQMFFCFFSAAFLHIVPFLTIIFWLYYCLKSYVFKNFLVALLGGGRGKRKTGWGNPWCGVCTNISEYFALYIMSFCSLSALGTKCLL